MLVPSEPGLEPGPSLDFEDDIYDQTSLSQTPEAGESSFEPASKDAATTPDSIDSEEYLRSLDTIHEGETAPRDSPVSKSKSKSLHMSVCATLASHIFTLPDSVAATIPKTMAPSATEPPKSEESILPTPTSLEMSRTGSSSSRSTEKNLPAKPKSKTPMPPNRPALLPVSSSLPPKPPAQCVSKASVIDGGSGPMRHIKQENESRSNISADGERRPKDIRTFDFDYPYGSRLFINNLPSYGASQQSIFDKFAPFGHIVEIRIRTHFAFVQYENVHVASRAMTTLNNTMMGNRQITVEVCRPQAPKDKSSRIQNPPPRLPSAIDQLPIKTLNGASQYRSDGWNPRLLNSRMHEQEPRPHHKRHRSRSPQVDDRHIRRDIYRRRTPSPSLQTRIPYSRPSSSPQSQSPGRCDVAILANNVSTKFLHTVEQDLKLKGLRIHRERYETQDSKTCLLQKHRKLGTHAIVYVDHNAQIRHKVDLQVFYRNQSEQAVEITMYQGQEIGESLALIIEGIKNHNRQYQNFEGTVDKSATSATAVTPAPSQVASVPAAQSQQRALQLLTALLFSGQPTQQSATINPVATYFGQPLANQGFPVQGDQGQATPVTIAQQPQMSLDQIQNVLALFQPSVQSQQAAQLQANVPQQTGHNLNQYQQQHQQQHQQQRR